MPRNQSPIFFQELSTELPQLPRARFFLNVFFPKQACPVGVLAVLSPSSWEVKKLAFLGGIAEESRRNRGGIAQEARLDSMAGARIGQPDQPG